MQIGVIFFIFILFILLLSSYTRINFEDFELQHNTIKPTPSTPFQKLEG